MTYLCKLAAGLCLLLISIVSATHSEPVPYKSIAAVAWNRGRETGLPIPRYVSLKPQKARLRVGPGTIYPIKWIYLKSGLPLELIDEYGHWRQVRDSTGTTGWMHFALLSGRRTGLVGPWLKTNAMLRSNPRSSASVVAELQPGVLLSLRSCTGAWCQVSVERHSTRGYVRQNLIWGAYPDEVFQ
ncbi:MAG: hypothetical protein KGI75_20845 [Rhizobiaceae bacterium]|nr:hypothetical protein [Rhizobiaceae bacterium]